MFRYECDAKKKRPYYMLAMIAFAGIWTCQTPESGAIESGEKRDMQLQDGVLSMMTVYTYVDVRVLNDRIKEYAHFP